MKKKVLLCLLVVVMMILCVYLYSKKSSAEYESYVSDTEDSVIQEDGFSHEDNVLSLSNISVSIIDTESLSESVLDILTERCYEYCIENNISDDTLYLDDYDENTYTFGILSTNELFTIEL
jgi:hypothetical protein